MNWRANITPATCTPSQLRLSNLASTLSHVHYAHLDEYGEMVIIDKGDSGYTQSTMDYLREHAPDDFKNLINGTTDYTKLPCLAMVVASGEGIPHDITKAGAYIVKEIETPLKEMLDEYSVSKSIMICTYIDDEKTREFTGGRYIVQVVSTEENQEKLQDIAAALHNEIHKPYIGRF